MNYHTLIPKGVLRVNAKQIWQATLERIQSRIDTAKFNTWFGGTSALSFREGVLIVGVPTPFVQTQLEGRFRESIRSILSDITGTPIDIHFEFRLRTDSANTSFTIRGYIRYSKATLAIGERASFDRSTRQAQYRDRNSGNCHPFIGTSNAASECIS